MHVERAAAVLAQPGASEARRRWAKAVHRALVRNNTEAASFSYKTLLLSCGGAVTSAEAGGAGHAPTFRAVAAFEGIRAAAVNVSGCIRSQRETEEARAAGWRFPVSGLRVRCAGSTVRN